MDSAPKFTPRSGVYERSCVSLRLQPELLVSCTKKRRADRVADNAWSPRESWRLCSAGSAGIVARVIVVFMKVRD